MNASLGKFYLASKSPRRAELLNSLRINFEVIESARPEQTHPEFFHSVKELGVVMEIAQDKAEGAWENFGENKPKNGLIISADTLVFLENRILGKPQSEREARNMLQALSGNMHTVATAVCAVRIGDHQLQQIENRLVTTEVTFAPLPAHLIDWYIETGDPMDKAGAYGAQSLGAVLVAKINGSYTNVVGLPLLETMEMVTEVTGLPWQVWLKT